MKQTFGSMPTTMPAGFFKAVRFPVLAMLDVATPDRRLLDAAGGGVRPLPMGIRYQPTSLPQHMESIPSGTLFEVTIDPDEGVMSGRGFLLDDPIGRLHARMIHTQAQDRNSVDLADVRGRLEEALDSDEWWVRFTKWNLGGTTGVGIPAFAEAHAVLDEALDDDELMASIIADPMEELVATCTNFDVNIVGAPDEIELVADGSPKPSFDDFHMPEPAMPRPLTVTEDGRVYAHLSVWESCHDGIEGRCMMTPRPTDSYASFNTSGVLTDRGMVRCGPLFLLGGHPEGGLQGRAIADAYGGIENAWADVRIIEGRHGPWMSGRVRPGLSDEQLHMARASRISGHWVNTRLVAVVSVNVPGFNVPGLTEGEMDLVAGFAFHVDDVGVSELVASFPPCEEAGTVEEQLELTVTLPADPALAERITGLFQAAVDEALAALGEADDDEDEGVDLGIDEDDARIAALLED